MVLIPFYKEPFAQLHGMKLASFTKRKPSSGGEQVFAAMALFFIQDTFRVPSKPRNSGDRAKRKSLPTTGPGKGSVIPFHAWVER